MEKPKQSDYNSCGEYADALEKYIKTIEPHLFNRDQYESDKEDLEMKLGSLILGFKEKYNIWLDIREIQLGVIYVDSITTPNKPKLLKVQVETNIKWN